MRDLLIIVAHTFQDTPSAEVLGKHLDGWHNPTVLFFFRYLRLWTPDSVDLILKIYDCIKFISPLRGCQEFAGVNATSLWSQYPGRLVKLLEIVPFKPTVNFP